MALRGKGVTVMVRSKSDSKPHSLRYDPEQVARMRKAKQVWDQTHSLTEVGRALGVTGERARQILDRGSSLGLYPKRRGASKWEVQRESMTPSRSRNLGQVFSDAIHRGSRRAVAATIKQLRRELSLQRQLISTLRKDVAVLLRDRKTLMDDFRKRLGQAPLVDADVLDHARLGARSIQALRRRLGFSKRDFARLLDVSPLTVSHWEKGKKPRPKGRAALLAARGWGKREARRRLAALTEAK